MPLLNESVDSIINGVSQQPAPLRLSSQNEEQVNGLSAIEDGVRKRPPLEHLGALNPAAGAIASNAKVHFVLRDDEDEVVVLLYDDDLKVFSLVDGTEQTVSFPDGKGYLDTGGSDPRDVFRCQSVVDYTFIVNRNVVTAMSGVASSTRGPELWYYVKQTASGVRHVIYPRKNGTDDPAIGIENPPAGDDTTDVTEDIFNGSELLGSFAEEGVEDWDAAWHQNVFFAIQNQNVGVNSWTFTTEDGFGNQYHTSGWSPNGQGYTETQNFSDLPSNFFEDGIVRVTGVPGSEFDDYFVKFVMTAQGPNSRLDPDFNVGGGYWTETVKPGIDNSLDATTMPHVLRRTGASTFSFEEGTWADRSVGDEDTAPEPQFIGRAFNDLAFMDDRLVLLADEGAFFSETSEYFNYWPTSVQTNSDSDPFAIFTPADETAVTIWDYAVLYREGLTLLSAGGRSQAEVNSGDTLTAKNVRIRKKGSFALSGLVKPVAVGDRIMIPVERSTASGMLEYLSTEGDADVDELTAHVPTYLPNGLRYLAASPVESTIVTCTGADPNLYIYRWFRLGTDKVMSSWSRWELGTVDTVLGVEFAGSDIIVVTARDDQAAGTEHHLWKFDLRKLVDESFTHRIYLDERFSATGVLNGGTGNVEFTAPYALDPNAQYRAVKGSAFPAADQGQDVKLSIKAGTTTILETPDGTLDNLPITIGRDYSTELTFSEVVPKTGSQLTGGRKSVRAGRLQLKKMTVDYVKSGYFRAEVTLDDEETYTYPIPGYVGVIMVGESPVEDGRLRFTVGGTSETCTIKLINDSWLPSTWTANEWEGYYAPTARR